MDVLEAALIAAEETGMIVVLDKDGIRFITPAEFGVMVEA